MNELKEITDDSWSSDVKSAPGMVLIDLWAPWCGPCKAMMPTVLELAKEYAAELRVAKVNVDENKRIAAELDVRGIPLFVLFRDGVETDRFVGQASKTALATFIESHL